MQSGPHPAGPVAMVPGGTSRPRDWYGGRMQHTGRRQAVPTSRESAMTQIVHHSPPHVDDDNPALVEQLVENLTARGHTATTPRPELAAAIGEADRDLDLQLLGDFQVMSCPLEDDSALEDLQAALRAALDAVTAVIDGGGHVTDVMDGDILSYVPGHLLDQVAAQLDR